MWNEDELEGPYGGRWQNKERRTFDAVKAMVPTATDDQVVELIQAIKAMMDDVADDLRNRMDGSGQYDPDY